jgi:hypothetical protein
LYGLGAVFWIYGMSRQNLISVYPFTILSFTIIYYLVGIFGLGERLSSWVRWRCSDPGRPLPCRAKRLVNRGLSLFLTRVDSPAEVAMLMEWAKKALASLVVFDTYQSLIGAPECIDDSSTKW